jgi:hypothetical protein
MPSWTDFFKRSCRPCMLRNNDAVDQLFPFEPDIMVVYCSVLAIAWIIMMINSK